MARKLYVCIKKCIVGKKLWRPGQKYAGPKPPRDESVVQCFQEISQYGDDVVIGPDVPDDPITTAPDGEHIPRSASAKAAALEAADMGAPGDVYGAMKSQNKEVIAAYINETYLKDTDEKIKHRSYTKGQLLKRLKALQDAMEK